MRNSKLFGQGDKAYAPLIASNIAEKVSKHLAVRLEHLFHQRCMHEGLNNKQEADRCPETSQLRRVRRYISEAIKLEELRIAKNVMLKELLHAFEHIRFPISPLSDNMQDLGTYICCAA
jgi:hypothetical protein